MALSSVGGNHAWINHSNAAARGKPDMKIRVGPILYRLGELCGNGHLLDEHNCYFRTKPNGRTYTECRRCKTEWYRTKRARTKHHHRLRLSEPHSRPQSHSSASRDAGSQSREPAAASPSSSSIRPRGA